MKRILDVLLSVRTSLWLLAALMALFLAGAVLMPTMPEYSDMNSGALFGWLGENPAGVTWWIWASVVMLCLLVVNTLFCSVWSVIKKRQNRSLLLVISPQIIHVGFLLMLVAHLYSSAWGTKGFVTLREGLMVKLTQKAVMRVASIDLSTDPMGNPTDWRMEVEFLSDSPSLKKDYLAPNKPAFFKGFGIYLKEVRPHLGTSAALVEITREPGAPWALAGGIFFAVGTLALAAFKIRKER